MKYTLNIIAENKPGVLYRVTGLFMKRKINVEHVNAFETKQKGISQIYVTAFIDPNKIDTIAKQIDKIVEILKVKYHKTL
ncbi:MAG: acetolactate synthase small subunit [bacterium]|nr:acetolactate synthase small subunit [bacterium]